MAKSSLVNAVFLYFRPVSSRTARNFIPLPLRNYLTKDDIPEKSSISGLLPPQDYLTEDDIPEKSSISILLPPRDYLTKDDIPEKSSISGLLPLQNYLTNEEFPEYSSSPGESGNNKGPGLLRPGPLFCNKDIRVCSSELCSLYESSH